jgi:hypothetical protein
MERSNMPEKDPNNTALIGEFFKQLLPYLSTLFLSCWGGIVSYIQRLRIHKSRFNWKDLTFDLVISSFAGLLTHFFCEYSNVGGSMSAILIAVSGHMGTRAIASFEKMRDRIFGVSEERRIEERRSNDDATNEKP